MNGTSLFKSCIRSVSLAEIIASPVLNKNIKKVIGTMYNQSQEISWPKTNITMARIANCGMKLINSRITADKGKRILGKLKVFSRPEFEVIALAPAENDPEKKEKRKTPVIKKGMKFAGRKLPRIKPKMSPYVKA